MWIAPMLLIIAANKPINQMNMWVNVCPFPVGARRRRPCRAPSRGAGFQSREWPWMRSIAPDETTTSPGTVGAGL